MHPLRRCQNICPVYRHVGGTAYGGVYGGPIGGMLTPLLHPQDGLDELSQASSLCAACDDVCPVRIPLHELLLGLRRRSGTRDVGLPLGADRVPGLGAPPGATPGLLPPHDRRRPAHGNIRVSTLFMHAPLLRRWTRTRDVRVKR